jgi:CubicO group peptidase (beta-lactamase class C family)
MRSLSVVAVCLLAIGACMQSPESAPNGDRAERNDSGAISSPVWPGENWAVASPSMRAKNETLIAEIDRLLGDGSYGNVNRFVLIHKGQLLADLTYYHDYEVVNEGRQASDDPYSYFNPDWHPFYKGTALHSIQSITKSVVAAAIGIAIERGEMPSLDTRVAEYLSTYQIQNDDALKRSITIEDLLTMRVGMDWNESSTSYNDPDNISTRMERVDDWDQFVLDQPMLEQPGTSFTYNSGASQLLSRILEEATGMRVEEYVEEFLFGPLGITGYYWKKTPGGRTDTVAGLYLRAGDLARIGYLYLNDGVWNGTRLMVAGWSHKTMQSPTRGIRTVSPAWQLGYGHQWWNYCSDPDSPCEVMAGLGWGGQSLLVYPQDDLVAVFYGWNIYGEELQSTATLLLETIIPRLMAE